MRKITLLLFALLLTTVGAWAQTTTPVVADGVYTIKNVHDNRGTMCYGTYGGTEYFGLAGITLNTYEGNSVTVADGDIANTYWYVKTTDIATYIYNIGKGDFLQARSGGNATFAETPGELTLANENKNGTDYVNIKSSTYYISFSCGYRPNEGQFRWMASLDAAGSPLTFTAVENASSTYATEIAAADQKIEEHEPSLVVTINVQNSGEDVQYTKQVKVNPGETITLKDYLPSFSFVTYNNTQATPTADNHVFQLGYTVNTTAEAAFPFVTSYSELDENKWVSFFTMYGRMFVYDDNFVTEGVKKYPAIDKATFTGLDDNYFWGFVRASRFSPLYIVNKGAGNGKYLYLTQDANIVPVLMGTEQDASDKKWFTKEWVVATGQTSGGEQYFSIQASGTTRYIQNYRSQGYMVTWQDGSSDTGSNIKFTSEINTYKTLKDRAKTAPKGAVHSLNDDARQAIENNTEKNVEGYKAVIADINNTETDAGFIQFKNGGYYYLQNYTPVGGETYVIGSDNGTSACAFRVTEGAADASTEMTYSNINAIWKIEGNGTPSDATNSDYVGTSKTIGRFVTHVNSGKRLTSTGTVAATSFPLNETGTSLYFVNLGAGQHFIKNVQYNGSGQQAKAAPIKIDASGNLARADNDLPHFKNSRETWYGIPVTSIKVTITDAGYATIYLPFGVTLPESSDLEAYAVTAAGDGFATLTKVEKSIPANEGVILKGTAGTTYTLTIDDTVTAWANGYNKLSGSCMAKNVSDDAYVLSKQNNVVGLYKADKSSGTWKNNDNKAYLLVSAVSNTPSGESRFLSFNFDTVTGLDVIKGTEPASSESVVYDLSGRRVRTAQKGLYIVNGKKVVK